MIKYNKFSFTAIEQATSNSYLSMIRMLFRGFSFEEAETLKIQINGYLNDRIIDEYDNPNVEFGGANETDWFELLGVLADKFDDLILDVANGDNDVELSMLSKEDK